jgi:hypothetical protein
LVFCVSGCLVEIGRRVDYAISKGLSCKIAEDVQPTSRIAI